MMIVSNSLFAQDTSHTKLVDKYYPVSKAPEQPAPILDKATSAPVNTSVTNPQSNTVSQSPQIQVNKTAMPVAPVASEVQAPLPPTPLPQNNVYSDTRLGSSSPENNTYKKNDNGAGSVTTDPNKGSGTNASPTINSNAPSPIYRDTRLGSSSPLYNTYEKNDNGAGAITTNPNKG